MSRWHVGLMATLASMALTVRPALAQCPDGSPAPCQVRAAAAPPRNSVAVLYFENLSPDTTDAYLADGLTEEIASRLGDIRRLLVKQASREGVRRLRAIAFPIIIKALLMLFSCDTKMQALPLKLQSY